MSHAEWLQAPLMAHATPGLAPDALPQPRSRRVALRGVSAPHRLLSLDMLRGCIMIVMAWDHSRDMLSDGLLPRDKGGESWTGPLATYDNQADLLLQRWLPHFCAPAFFWLMGAGMAFFYESRRKKFASRQWNNRRVCKHFAVRGALLILFDRLINIPMYTTLVNASHWAPGFPLPGLTAYRGLLSIFEVLTSLGLCMILCGLCLPLFASLNARWRITRGGVILISGGQIAAALLGVVAFIVSGVVVVHFQGDNPVQSAPWPRAGAQATSFSDYLVRFAVLPGLFGSSDVAGNIAYPILPWIALTLWGIAAGQFLLSSVGRERLASFALVQGGICWGLFVLIRTFGGAVGNFRGWPRGEPNRSENFIIAWLTVCKYPPSVAYASLTLSGVSLLLAALDCGVQHLAAVATQAEQRLAYKHWMAGMIQQADGSKGVDFPPLEHAPLPVDVRRASRPASPFAESPRHPVVAIASSEPPLRTITVQVVRPSAGAVEDVEQQLADSIAVPGLCCTRSTWSEFPMWPWYGRWLLFPLLTFGRVPLFYYIVHWYILGLGALLFHSVGNGIPMAQLPLWWLCLQVLMYLLCAPYAKFKDRKGTDSLWRFL